MIPKFRAWLAEENAMCKVLDLIFHPAHLDLRVMVVEFEERRFTINPKTAVLMQSTGLFDSAGVEIYLGDIVQREYEYGPASIAPIIYVPRCAKFMLNQKNEKGGWDTDVDVYKTTKLTVLGNRYQHPHLLEKTA